MISTSLHKKKLPLVSISITLALALITQYFAIRDQLAIFMPGYSGLGIEPLLFTIMNGVMFPFLWLINYANTVMAHRLLKMTYGRREIFLSFIIPFLTIFMYLASPFVLGVYSSYHEKSVKEDFNIEFSYPSVEVLSNGACRFSWGITNNSTDIAEDTEINFNLSVKIPDVEQAYVHLCATNMRLHQDLNPGLNVIKGVAEPSHYNDRKHKNKIKDLPIMMNGYVLADKVMFRYKEQVGEKVRNQVLDNLDAWFLPRF